LGCYSISQLQALPNRLDNCSRMTSFTCQSLAVDWGYTYFALQAGGACWAGNDLAAAQQHGPSADCSTSCKADLSQTCGGPNDNALYAT